VKSSPTVTSPSNTRSTTSVAKTALTGSRASLPHTTARTSSPTRAGIRLLAAKPTAAPGDPRLEGTSGSSGASSAFQRSARTWMERVATRMERAR
jgi:hypothetical protein